jgi:S1-C subfamily serine protease
MTLFLYDLSKTPPQQLTQADIDAAVVRTLESVPPPPPPAQVAYEVVRPSTVRLEASSPDGRTGVGSGVVIDDSGTILTSLHVVRGANEVRVYFADGSETKAAIVAEEAESDLAALRPEVIPDDLIPATLAGGAGIGDDVYVVGNPFGIRDSLTAGVVSGLGRQYRSPRTGETLNNLIQFDAAVNPGNSGGPLVNRNGEVVGIVTGLFNPTEQDVFIGIGFAVPIETAMGGMGEPPY